MKVIFISDGIKQHKIQSPQDTVTVKQLEELVKTKLQIKKSFKLEVNKKVCEDAKQQLHLKDNQVIILNFKSVEINGAIDINQTEQNSTKHLENIIGFISSAHEHIILDSSRKHDNFISVVQQKASNKSIQNVIVTLDDVSQEQYKSLQFTVRESQLKKINDIKKQQINDVQKQIDAKKVVQINKFNDDKLTSKGKAIPRDPKLINLQNQEQSIQKDTLRLPRKRRLSESKQLDSINQSGNQTNQTTFQDKNINKSLQDQSEAHDLLRRIHKQRQQLERRSQKEINSSLYENDGLLSKKQEDPEALNEKRRKFQEKLEQDKEIKELQAQLNIDGNKLIKQIQDDIKHQEQQRKQKDEQMNLPELERRKLVLASKRQLSQPIRLDELNQHKKKYEDEMRLKQFVRQQCKNEALLQDQARVQLFPKSQAYLRVEEDDNLEKDKFQRDKEAKKQQRLKLKKYVEVIQEMFPVPLPQKSKMETENPQNPTILNPQTSNSQTVRDHYPLENLKVAGQQEVKKIEKALRYKNEINQFSDAQNQKKDQHQLNLKHLQELNRSIQKIDLRNKRSQSQEAPYDLQDGKPQKTRFLQFQTIRVPDLPIQQLSRDYLTEMRINRQNQVEPSTVELQKIIGNQAVPLNIRTQNVLKSVSKLERRAKEKEIIAVTHQDIDAEDEANDLYIQSIKVKLALLE